ncbi:hypothetical protein MATR_23890 [Marivirga tractuosa]|uniref:Outer membrane lipoprotein-sorting protein n=1 Tax=Marivirga tractuosa (strain ATCC 23168 / DSM 4126 / NBRC 15989 / NCIMB 1408 / VKM B-1430 / H-43) TaxID=643867 RepID=E4TRA1_MARTH|nr:outer membrane lipoprotein-sorting protein [Marivirga tractuosa]ADR23753.1 hypothetical protein Ftrac_3787 [Marivirga tractuosa DSM 4126]BDD15564.1 hypothetical protein MATR_23890 [Marivirga tractuosa]
MKLKLLLPTIALLFSTAVYAQDITADEIINNYFENTGGKEAWGNLEGIKMTAKINQGGMEIPVEIVQLKTGKMYTKASLQGKELMQNVFDGEVLWSTNFQTMKAEKSDQETTDNAALETKDFPDALFNYKERGYQAELVGKETIEGAETYKVKLTKKPKKVDGKEVENITFYYFETENFVPILQETEIKQAPMAGKIQQTTMSDYQEVEGLYFPFSISSGIKDMGSQAIQIESIELNPEIDDEVFMYPTE